MTHPTAGALRWTRSAVMTAVIVGLAAAAHVLGGGRLPAPPIVAALLVAVTCATFLSTSRRLGFGAVTTVLGTGQLLLHEAFTTLASTGVTLPVTGHVHTTGQLSAQLPVMTSSMTDGPVHGSSGLMVLGHVTATVLTAAAVARGEHALWALLAWLSPLAHLVCRVVVPVRAREVRTPPQENPQRPRVLLLARQVPRRGPPALTARA